MAGDGEELKNLIWGAGLGIEEVGIALGMSRQGFAYYLNKAKVSDELKEKVIKYLKDRAKNEIKQQANKNLKSTITQSVNNSDSEATLLKDKIADLERIIADKEEIIRLLKNGK